jgi:hypothetical protein
MNAINPDSIIRFPGKFEGERQAVSMAYQAMLEGAAVDYFGDTADIGFYCRVTFEGAPHIVCFVIDSLGFVSEVSNELYELRWLEHVEALELETVEDETPFGLAANDSGSIAITTALWLAAIVLPLMVAIQFLASERVQISPAQEYFGPDCVFKGDRHNGRWIEDESCRGTPVTYQLAIMLEDGSEEIIDYGLSLDDCMARLPEFTEEQAAECQREDA